MADQQLNAPKNIFDTPEKIQSAIINLQGLKVNEGWLTITQLLDENIKFYEKEILENTKLTQDQADELKLKRKLFIYLKELPDQQIKELSNTDAKQTDDDPFD